MEEKKIIINSLTTNYKISGTGEPLLILHGWGGSSDSWIGVQEILAKQGYKVICPDFPGFGKSFIPPEIWGIDDYTKWLSDFVISQNFKKFFLLGHSFGGRIAIRFAKDCPEKLKGLILCDSAGIKPKLGVKTRITFFIARIGNAIFTSKPLIRFKDTARNLFYIFLRHRDYAKAEGTMKEIIKKVLEEDLLPDLSKIKTKTLIIWGKEDKIVPVNQAHIFKEKIPDSKLEIIPKVGHSPHLEVPEKLFEILLKFIKKEK